MPGLEVRGLVKRLGGHTAVDGLSFSVSDGEFLVLLGPSGCGKTTTLRVICGLEEPDAGDVVIGGRSVTSLPSRERNLGMVFQEYGLYPSMDVFGNMAYGLQARGGFSKAEIERRVRDAAGRLDLTALLQQPVTDLSGGEQQRISLGRAMVKDADAYLFDEPLSNLDPKLRHRVRRDIMSLHRDKGRPSVYVTHDQTEAFAMGDRIAVMAGGRLQQIGAADDLLENPANTFMAGFVGSPPMNLLAARLGSREGTFVARVPGAELPLPGFWSAALAGYPREAVTVGIRPDSVELRPESVAGDVPDAFTGEVIDVEPLIGETVVRMKTGGGDALAAVFTAGEEDVLAIGEVIRVGVRPDRIRLFDSETEQALPLVGIPWAGAQAGPGHGAP